MYEKTFWTFYHERDGLVGLSTGPFFFAVPAESFMEVTVMKTRKILSAVGTFVIVGAVSTAGAALWTNVLDRKFQMVKVRLTHPKSDKIIFVDFRKAGRGR